MRTIGLLANDVSVAAAPLRREVKLDLKVTATDLYGSFAERMRKRYGRDVDATNIVGIRESNQPRGPKNTKRVLDEVHRSQQSTPGRSISRLFLLYGRLQRRPC